MHVEALVLGQPLLDVWMFVRGVVACDQMKRLALWCLAVHLPKKLQPLNVAMTLLALRDDLTIEDMECCNSVVVPLSL